MENGGRGEDLPERISSAQHSTRSCVECTYTNLDSIAYYTPRLYGTAYCS